MSFLLAAVPVLVAQLVLGRVTVARLRRLETWLQAIHQQVGAAQVSHDHQVASLDRRMRDVEITAARAEREARIVSLQITSLHSALGADGGDLTDGEARPAPA